MSPSRKQFESGLRLFAASLCVACVALLSAIVSGSVDQTLPSTVFFLVFSAGCAFIVFAGGLGASTAGGLGAVVAISIAIALANSTQISPLPMVALTFLVLAVLVVVGRIAGDTESSIGMKDNRRQIAAQPAGSRMLLDQSSQVWEPAVRRHDLTAMLGQITLDYCRQMSREGRVCVPNAEKQSKQSNAEVSARLGAFVGVALKQRLRARHAEMAHVQPDGKVILSSATEDDVIDPLTSDQMQQINAGQAVMTDWIQTSDLTCRQPQWILPLDHSGTVACVFGMSEELACETNAGQVGQLLMLFSQHLNGLAALAHASGNTQGSRPDHTIKPRAQEDLGCTPG
jgi:hypothetical protein